jgi:hypothetical protein
MAVLATDAFTRANNADLGTAWDVSTGQGAFAISGNTAISNFVGDAGESYNAITWPDDQYVQAAVTVTGGTTPGGGAGLGVQARAATGAWTAYRLVVSTAVTNNIELAKFVAAGYTLLGQRTQAWTAGDTLRLEAQGTTLRVLRNGVQLGATFTDSGIASGRGGIVLSFGDSVAGSLDNFEGGDFGTPLPPRLFIGGLNVAGQRAAGF